MPLEQIETIVFVMLENRSFDHMLGYLSLTPVPGGLPVEGLRNDAAWLRSVANAHGEQLFAPALLGRAEQRMADPPHDHASITIQINTARAADPASRMGGFVDSYMARHPPPPDAAAVMGFYDANAVPVFDFLARHFTVCDHWFAALPCGTQPNRLIAMSGESRILDNATVFLPEQPLVYDWLAARGISWAAYQWGDFVPFFTLMARLVPEITTSLALSALGGRGRFRRYDRFRHDWLDTGSLPSVIFIEPEYTDGPHLAPNDDHPPTGIAHGQAFVADIYNTLIANPARWRNTVMIVTYDEHGGFFDHVPPLPIPANVDGTTIATSGVRVPALVISPHAEPGTVFSANLDHTSFLQLLADKFTPGTGYSDAVSARQASLGRLSAALPRQPGPEEAAPRLDPGVLAQLNAACSVPRPKQADSASAIATTAAFKIATAKMVTEHPDIINGPGWEKLATLMGAS